VKLKRVSVQCLTDRTASLVNAVIPPTHSDLLTSLNLAVWTRTKVKSLIFSQI
jgi:hypothetical protein